MAKKKADTPKTEHGTQSVVALKVAEHAAKATVIRIGQIGDYRPVPKFKGCRNC